MKEITVNPAFSRIDERLIKDIYLDKRQFRAQFCIANRADLIANSQQVAVHPRFLFHRRQLPEEARSSFLSRTGDSPRQLLQRKFTHPSLMEARKIMATLLWRRIKLHKIV